VVKEAGKQLENEIRDYGTANTYGLVAISFAKLFSPSQIPIPILNGKLLDNSWIHGLWMLRRRPQRHGTDFTNQDQ
jgi:hypothetical protein